MRVTNLIAGPAAGVRCGGCRRPGSLLCEICARAAPRGADDPPIEGIDRVVARWAYEGVPRSLILDLKIRGARLCASALADGLAAAALANGILGSVITWVPGRRSDMRVRGFDHAGLLAREVARRLGISRAELLIRLTDPPDQTLLSAEDRKQNLRGAFGARACSGPVIVVDDLVTTGATGAACARALRAAGADGVEFLVACRA